MEGHTVTPAEAVELARGRIKFADSFSVEKERLILQRSDSYRLATALLALAAQGGGR